MFAASVDSPETNASFARSLELAYPILSDPSRDVARAYGVLSRSGFASRWTFYIGADGRILSGRAEIEQSYREVMSGGPKRLAHAHPPETIRIRFLQPDVAFVDVESASVAGPGPRTPFFLVFTKVQGKWGVAVERRGVPLK